MRLIGTASLSPCCFQRPASAAKASKVHRVARSVQQSESVHRSRARAACDVAAHETDGTTTCLDRGSDNVKDDTRARQADLQKEIAARQPECRVCQMHPDFIELGQADASYGSRRMSASGCRIQS